MKVQLKGLEGVLKKIDDYPKQIKEEVAGEISTTCEAIVAKAVGYAPADEGFLRNNIVKKNNENSLTNGVVCNAEYAPYVEWGTKSKVNVPAGLEAYAATFKGKGSGNVSFYDKIEKWLDRHGIKDRSHRYFIKRKIMREGINPHPFFFRAADEETPELIDRLKKLLNAK
jgi:hypothetical protein